MEEHRLKAETFDLLSLGFLYPSEERFEATRDGYFDALADRMRQLGLEQELATVHEDEVAIEREKEYTRLFVNAFPDVVAPPYESVYMDGKGRVWGESTSSVLKLYRSAGIDISESFHDVPDHIAAELAFASYLKASIYAGDYDKERIYKVLIVEHLGRWAPEFLHKVISASRIEFYRRLASSTALLIDLEKRVYDMALP